MASRIRIKGYLVEDKGTWVVRARFPDYVGGKEKLHSKSTGLKVAGNNKRKAESAMREIVEHWEMGVKERTVLDDNITFGKCVESWLETKEATTTEGTSESYWVHYHAHIEKSLGHIRLRDLTRQDIQAYFNSLDGVLSPNTMRRHFVIIAGALDEAVLNGWLLSDAGNVLKRIKLPKKTKFEGKSLTEEQVEHVLKRLSDENEPVRSAVVLGMCYGLRRSEICGLRWEDVDFDERVIHIRNTVTDYNGTRVERERTKTLKSRRDLPLMDSTFGYLKALYDRRTEQGMVSNKVCAYEDGRSAKPDYVTRHVEAFLAGCGIEGMRLHDLRHTAGSLLVKRLPVIYVSEFLGHNQVSTTLNVYSHVLENERDRAALEMESFLCGVMPASEKAEICSENCSETASGAV